MNGITTGHSSRGRGLAMSVTAALAGMLLIAVPAGAASAVDTPTTDDAVAQVETPATLTETEPEEMKTTAPADAPQAELEVRAAEARAAEVNQAEAEAPVAETPEAAAVTADRTISGTVKFPANMTLAQKRSLRVYLNKDGATSVGTHYSYGQEGFTYNPGATATTATWSVTGLSRIKYHIWVDAAVGSYQSSPLYMGPYNAATGYDGPIDLTSKNFAVPTTLDVNVGSVSVTVSAEMSVKGRYELTLVNQQSGAEHNVRNTVFSGDTVGNVNNARHDFNGAPGTYKLRAKLNNGVTLYYDGTLFGTRDVSKATSFKIGLHQRIQLKPFDLREFMDVPVGYKFADDINWLAKEGVTTGVKQADGTRAFLPKDSVSREAMVAFLFRLDPEAASYRAPAKSPFTDVTPKHKFFKQIMWAYENKVTKGIAQPGGKLKFAPSDRISREAMAAFMFRQYQADISTKPGAKPLVDVPKGHKFYKEITWMSSNGITTGVKQPNGSLAFAPKDRTSREATAAFLHRAEVKK